MLAEIELEVLQFFSRDMLDAYQLASSAKNTLVARNASTLALRRISKVVIVSNISINAGCPNIRPPKFASHCPILQTAGDVFI